MPGDCQETARERVGSAPAQSKSASEHVRRSHGPPDHEKRTLYLQKRGLGYLSFPKCKHRAKSLHGLFAGNSATFKDTSNMKKGGGVILFSLVKTELNFVLAPLHRFRLMLRHGCCQEIKTTTFVTCKQWLMFICLHLLHASAIPSYSALLTKSSPLTWLQIHAGFLGWVFLRLNFKTLGTGNHLLMELFGNYACRKVY